MITVKVTCSNGNSWVTSINATIDEARAYFIGFEFAHDEPDGTETFNTPVTVEEVPPCSRT